ncbi:DedA family protein [Pseudogemmobacter sp. W21_MBD1_M6]|uniref:DedA family protein n=1 Tax=Pseudogemmobacter sp. W21_MBD1_M6 TaxID=3240271 RepID=UPI003F95389E
MTEFLLLLITGYGTPVLVVVTFLSCLALPVPASLMMLAAGGFAAAGDLDLSLVWGSALVGAVAGDQTGYGLGNWGGARLARWTNARPSRAAMHRKALRMAQKFGGLGVFFSRWLFSPIGPYVNVAGGAAGLGWLEFTLWGISGEIVWVSLYVGLGYAFADRIIELASLLGSANGFLAGGIVTAGLGIMLMNALAKTRKRRHRPPQI